MGNKGDDGLNEGAMNETATKWGITHLLQYSGITEQRGEERKTRSLWKLIDSYFIGIRPVC